MIHADPRPFCRSGQDVHPFFVLLLVVTATVQCTYENEAAPGLVSSDNEQSFKLVATQPEPGQQNVSTRQVIELQFNVAPNADTVPLTNLRVFAGLVETPGTLKLDLLERTVRFTPLSQLRPNLRHQVYVHRSIRGLNGANLGDTVIFNFTTGTDDTLAPEPEPPQVDSARVQAEIFDRRCATCHTTPLPPLHVDLSSVQASSASLRAQPASFGGKLRVAPFNHSTSYLMFKLLGEGGFVGFRMPATGARLTHEQLRLVAAWIDAGAGP